MINELIIFISLVAGATIVGIITPLILRKNDTRIEQAAEKVIKDKTGIDIDFSPEKEDE